MQGVCRLGLTGEVVGVEGLIVGLVRDERGGRA